MVFPLIGVAYLAFLAGASAWCASRARDEWNLLTPVLRILQSLSGLTLLFSLSPWLALILAGALAIGWLPLAVALGYVGGTGNPATLALATPLALLAGARWAYDGRAALHLAIAILATGLLVAGVASLGG
jgi:hypothetical protein